MRIRSIKPEFWRSEDITSLAWDDRLLFIGLWSYVDDNGVGRDVEKLIMADLFPLEDDPRETLATVSRGLQNLFDKGLIARYHVDGAPLLHVTNWAKHQRIDKPNKARYEPPTCANAVIRDTLATVSRVSREIPAPGAVEQGSRGAEEQGKGETPRADALVETDRFDEFWDTYDKKRGRKDSEKKYRLALKKPGVTQGLLIAAAESYIAWQRQEGKHPQFTKDASRWLNGEHWTDERVARVGKRTNVQEHLTLVQQLAAEEAEQPTLPQIGTGR